MNDYKPCIVYQRLRPRACRASDAAMRTTGSLVEGLVKDGGFTLRGLFGDSEFAPPFCGASEVRPGFEAALETAKSIAAERGACTLIIGNAGPIGDGDPFLPSFDPEGSSNVEVVLINCHLRPGRVGFPLRSAWRRFARELRAQKQPHIIPAPRKIFGSDQVIEVFVRRDPERLRAHLYANTTAGQIELDWKRLVRQPGRASVDVNGEDWIPLDIHSGFGAYLETIYQGDLPWVRQLRFKHREGSRKRVGVLHLTPSDLARKRLPLIWEARG